MRKPRYTRKTDTDELYLRKLPLLDKAKDRVKALYEFYMAVRYYEEGAYEKALKYDATWNRLNLESLIVQHRVAGKPLKAQRR